MLRAIDRRSFLRRSALLASALLAESCAAPSPRATPTAPPATATPNVTAPSPAPTPTVQPIARPAPSPTSAVASAGLDVEHLLQRMTLEQRVGQLLIVAFREDTPAPVAAGVIRDVNVGGMILFAGNLGDVAHARELTSALQALARGSGAGVPLFLSIDQEGGVVYRAAAGATVWPSQMLLGAARDPALVERMARLAAVELRAVG